MRRLLRWLGIIIGGLVGLVVVVLIGFYLWTGSRLARTYDIPPSGIVVPSSPEAVERGRHFAEVIYQCGGCHGENMGGQVMFEDFLTGRLAGSNLTAGEGGVGQRYTDEDWVRAVRHGVLPNGRAGVAMVSNVFYYLSDADVGAMIAYLKSLPPVDNVVPPTRLGLMGRVYLLMSETDILPAAGIDHAAPRPPDPAPGVTVEYGQYLARVCTFCHGNNYAGFSDPEAQSTDPMPANLTPAGDLSHWTEADFMNTLRTGYTPEGKLLDPEAMPWRSFGQMTDDELKAIWMFLQTLPPADSAPPG
jgi:mono/diheme cytochrome c family protein